MKRATAAKDALSPYGLAVVTGGSSGIGKCFIASMRQTKPVMGICNISRRKLELPGVDTLACDLSVASDRRTLMGRVVDWIEARPEAGKLLLINNSGFGCYGAFPEPKASEHAGMIAVNVAALVELTAALLPELKKRGGAIINVASTAAFQPLPFFATYAATKAFVLNWSIALDRELRDSGVNVQALCPGPTHTGFHRRAGLSGPAAIDRFAWQPEAVVTLSWRGLHRRRPIVVCGVVNRVATALTSRLPRVWVARLAGRVIRRQRLEQLT